MLKVLLRPLRGSWIGEMSQVSRGNDTELANISKRTDFRIAEIVTTAAIVDKVTRTLQRNIWSSWLGSRFRLRPSFGTAPIYLGRWLAPLGLGRQFALSLHGLDKFLPFAQRIESRHA